MKPSLHVAYAKQGRPTGKVIADLIGATSHGNKAPNYTPDILLRWGSRREGIRFHSLEVNSPSAIRKASNKIICLKTLQEAGVPIPVFTETWEEMVAQARNGRYVLGRSAYGFGGKDIKVYETGYGPVPTRGQHDWFSLYINVKREYRLHVVGDKVIRIQGKYNDNPELARKSPFVRNYAAGWRFRAPRQDLHTSRKQSAINAVKACGLDYGAVDLVLDERGQEYVLEINTAPSCSPLTAKCYAGALGSYLAQKSGGEWEVADKMLAIEMEEALGEGNHEERYR